jgi:methylated-DNA-[protein]-cysteine S-methyltransferase
MTSPEIMLKRSRVDRDDVERATRGVLARADEEGAMDVAFASVDTPFGPMIVAATAKGLVRISLSDEYEEEVLQELADKVSPRVLELPRRIDPIRRELDEYFAGTRHDFDVKLDWRLSHGFAQRVLRATARVPYGRVTTYKQMAEKAGNVRASRAAGNALGSNPIPIVVPCHRVLHSGGGLGGYGGGLPMKEALLKMEGALLA